MAVEGGRVEFGPSFRLAPDFAVEDECQGWRLRHRRRRRALGRALDGDLCAATGCPALEDAAQVRVSFAKVADLPLFRRIRSVAARCWVWPDGPSSCTNHGWLSPDVA